MNQKLTAEFIDENLNRITRKCEQYWNEPNISDAEAHAAFEFIHREVSEIIKSRKGAK